MATLTKTEILANRQKFAKGLQEPHRLKATNRLESILNPNKRCCLGHGCEIFGLKRAEWGGEVHYNGEAGIAPPALVDLLGLIENTGWVKSKSTSLTEINDETAATPQEIGKMIEEWIEGGDGTPFKSLDQYPN